VGIVGRGGKNDKKRVEITKICTNLKELREILGNLKIFSLKIAVLGGGGIVGIRVENFLKMEFGEGTTIRDGRVG